MFLKYYTYVNVLMSLVSTQTTVTSPTTNATTIGITTTIGHTTTVATTMAVPCSSEGWPCGDGRCVQKCDGVFHCRDGSDETLKLCRDKTERPLLGIAMHCASPWCEQYPDVCPEICCHQPEYCYYALYAPVLDTTCALPEFPKKGNYSVQVDEIWDGTNRTVLVDFSLKFNCVYGTVLQGDDVVHCLNKHWTEKFPYCSEACKLIRIPHYQYTCTNKNRTYPCGDYVALGSRVAVENSEGGKSGAHIYCNLDKKFNISTECVPELEALQKEFETKTMKEIDRFESNFVKSDNRSFEFQQLVEEYYDFEKYVKGNSSELNRLTAECGIYLSLLEHDKKYPSEVF